MSLPYVLNCLTMTDDNTFIELHDHHKALEQEFAQLNITPEDTPDQLRQKARTFAIHHLQDAFDALADLLNSSKDATRLSAAKAVINVAMQTTPNDEANPFEELFKSLTTTDTDETTDSSRVHESQ